MHCWQTKVTPILLSDFSYSLCSKDYLSLFVSWFILPTGFFFYVLHSSSKKILKVLPFTVWFLTCYSIWQNWYKSVNLFNTSLILQELSFLNMTHLGQNILIWGKKKSLITTKTILLESIYLCPTYSQNQSLAKTQDYLWVAFCNRCQKLRTLVSHNLNIH